MRIPWQRTFLVGYAIALMAGLILLWIGFELRQIDRQVRTAEEEARQFAQESQSLLQLPQRYSELVTNLGPESLGQMKAILESYGASRQPSLLDPFWKKHEQINDLLDGLSAVAPQSHVIVLQPVQADVSLRALITDVQSHYHRYIDSVLGFTNELATATQPYREIDSYQAVQRRYAELEKSARMISLQKSIVESSLYAAGGWFEQTQALTEAWRAKFTRLVILLITPAVVLLGALIHLIYRGAIQGLQRQVIKSRSAEEASMERFRKLATTLAHEIRNPLTAINVRLFTLQHGLKEDSSEHADATVIRGEIDRLNRYLKEFLQFTRPGEPNFVTMTAQPLLNEIRALLAAELAEREITLQVAVTEDASFSGDADKLKQVLINLVKNSAESIGHQGQITLRASKTSHRFDDQPLPALLIEVVDSGPGIAAEIADQVFAPFYSTKKEGTGLGLPTAAQIVKDHGGRLEFRSPRAGETIFCILLPLSAG